MNDRGKLIAINTAIIAHGSEGNQGIGFAVPSGMGLEVNGKPVQDANGLRMTISMLPPDTTVSVKVFRDGGNRDFSVKLAELPTEQAANLPKSDNGWKNSSLSGVSVQNLDADTAQQLGNYCLSEK